MKDVAVLIPTLGRPQHIEPLLNSLYGTTDRAVALFLTTESDKEARAEIDRLGERRIDVIQARRGDYARKINTGYRETKEPFLFLAATDLKFHEDWLENAMKHMSDDIHVVGTNDLGNPRVIRGEHSTHTLVSRYYCTYSGTIDEKHKVLHENYPHEYVDDEFIETAKCRNTFEMAIDSIVEHDHPAWGKAKWDKSYKEVDKRLRPGYRIFHKRRHLWTQL